MYKQITEIGEYDLKAIEKGCEEIHLHVHQRFREFISRCEDTHDSANGHTCHIMPYWIHNLAEEDAIKYAGDDGVFRWYSDHHRNELSKILTQEHASTTSLYQFSTTRFIGAGNADAHTLYIEVMMEMKWRNSQATPGTFNGAFPDPAVCKVTMRVRLDNYPFFGSLTGFKRSGIYRHDTQFFIYPENSSFLLAVHMMFVKSQICTHLARIYPDFVGQVDQWHAQWGCYSIEAVELHDWNGDTDNSAQWHDQMRKNEATFYISAIDRISSILDQITEVAKTGKLRDEHMEVDDMGIFRLGRVKDKLVIIDNLIKKRISQIVQNASSSAGGGIFPLIYINPQTADETEVTIIKDKAFDRRIECCSANQDENDIVRNQCHRITIFTIYPDGDKGKLEKLSAIERILDTYVGMLYSQMSDAFGVDMAYDFLSFQQDTYHGILKRLRNEINSKNDEKKE